MVNEDMHGQSTWDIYKRILEHECLLIQGSDRDSSNLNLLQLTHEEKFKNKKI